MWSVDTGGYKITTIQDARVLLYPRPVRSCEQGNKRDSTLLNLDRPRLISGCSDDAAVSGPAGQFGSVG